MTYTIEISFDIRNKSSFTNFKNKLLEIADKNKCISNYTLHEMEGGQYVERNHCILTINFNQPDECENFIKYIKPIKKVYIECIYKENPGFKIIYSSSYYQKKKMSNEGRKIYKNNIYDSDDTKLKKMLIH